MSESEKNKRTRSESCELIREDLEHFAIARRGSDNYDKVR